MEEGDVCPKCCKGILHKPKVLYRVFEGRRRPDFMCDHCGAPSWELPKVIIPPISFKLPRAIGEEKNKPVHKKPWWLIRKEKKRRAKQQQLAIRGP